LCVLGVAALTFTVVGLAGVAHGNVLASVTLALLAILAVSRVRSRRRVARDRPGLAFRPRAGTAGKISGRPGGCLR